MLWCSAQSTNLTAPHHETKVTVQLIGQVVRGFFLSRSNKLKEEI